MSCKKSIMRCLSRRYAELGIDSFESIVGAFSKISEVGEGAALQMLIRPASAGCKKKGQPLY